MNDLDRLLEISAVLPPVLDSFNMVECGDDDDSLVAPVRDDLQPISAFVCIISYLDRSGTATERLITCQRYDLIGEVGYVGAICHAARSYRQFRTDRIECVSDPQTGETIGAGDFFSRFTADTAKSCLDSWGLERGRKAHLIAGLNILAFMARCDGHWHPLEEEVIERFTTSLWLRKEWENDPPIELILAHARRIAPDGVAFFKGLKAYARSRTSTAVLKRGVSDLIAADGLICDEEHRWAMAMLEYLDAPEALESYSER